MCDLNSMTTNQTAMAALFRVLNQSVGNLPPMLGVPGLPCPVVRQRRRRARGGPDALGKTTAATHGGPTCHKHPQHFLAALAGMFGA
jgi:hypothetical protein